MRLLDLFCKAGGAAVGYHRAGFDEIVGVDIEPQSRYPFKFVQADALEYVAEHGAEFDVIHASPPCQAYSVTRSLHDNEYPDLVDVTRSALERAGVPYVIENVVGAPLRTVVILCGTMFDGLRVYRHRLFESNVLIPQPFHPAHIEPTIQRGYAAEWDGFVTIAGGHNVPVSISKNAMQIDWMTRDELSQAIPPAYTEYIGRYLLAHLRAVGES